MSDPVVLNPDLEDSINDLVSRHDSLLATVDSYIGNASEFQGELEEAKQSVMERIDAKESALLGLIQKGTTRPVPSLVSDFSNKTFMLGKRRLEKGVPFDGMWNLKRASSKWAMDQNGMLVEYGPNVPAYSYDPVSGEPQGLLIEGQRTNLWTWSTDLTKASIGTGTSVTPTELKAPDGTNTVFKIESLPTGGIRVNQIIEVTPGETYTLSFYALSGSMTTARALFHDATNNVVIPSGPTFQLQEGVFTRVNGSVTAPADCTQLYFYLLNGGYPEQYFYVTSPQIEEGPFPTSYIKTEGSQVTRAADTVVIDLSGTLNPNEGTYVVRAVVKDEGEVEYYAGWYGTLVSSRVSFKRLASGNYDLRVAGGVGMSITPPEYLKAGDIVTLAITYKEGQITAAAFGETSALSLVYTPEATMNLVRGTGVNLDDNNQSLESSGNIAGFEYYPRALSEQELITLTAPEA